MTYAMLHEKSGLSVSTIGNILNVRENSCRTDTLDLLADALDIDDWHSLACSFAEKTYHVRWYGSLRPDVINGQTDYLGSVTGYCINAKNESEAIDAFLEYEFDNAYKMRKEKPDYYDVICDEALSGYLGSATMIAELPNMVDDETYKIMSEYKSRLAIINKNMSFEERNNTFKGILQSNEIKKYGNIGQGGRFLSKKLHFEMQSNTDMYKKLNMRKLDEKLYNKAIQLV